MANEYINRKAAMEYLYRAINADPDGNCPSCIHDEHECQYDRCWTLMDFCEKIEYIGYVPAADVVPVRHGRWMLKTFDDGYGGYQLYECDQCGAHTAQKCRNYCHNCGAKMEVDE